MLNKIKPSNTPLTLCYLYLPLTNQHQPFQFETKKKSFILPIKKKAHPLSNSPPHSPSRVQPNPL